MLPIRKSGCVSILTNEGKTVLCTGVTSDLRPRMWQHRNQWFSKSFKARYHCIHLAYYHFYETIAIAISSEKRLKAKQQKEKERLINSRNPQWLDLWETIPDF
jgi:putative endonuclease